MDKERYTMLTSSKEAGIAVLNPDKTDCRARKVISDKEGYYVIMKWLILQVDITILNVYASSHTSRCVK